MSGVKRVACCVGGIVVAYAAFGLACFDPTAASYESVDSRQVSETETEHDARLVGPAPRSGFFGCEIERPWLNAILRPWVGTWTALQAGHFPPSRKVVIHRRLESGKTSSGSAIQWRLFFHVRWSDA